MINMLKADLYRLIRSKGFYIAMLILLLTIGISIYFVSPGYFGINDSAGTMDDNVAAQMQSVMSQLSKEEQQSISISKLREIMLTVEGYELDRDILSVNMNLYYIFIFMAAIILTVDFSGGSVKNTLSSAISRNKYYLSKLCLITLCCTAILFLNTYIVYFANILFNGKSLASSLGTVTKITLLQLPPTLALASILTDIGFMTKKTSLFNTITIPLIMVSQIVLRVVALIFEIKEEFMYYEFQQMLRKLANNPTDTYILNSFLVCAVVIVVFNLLGYLSFRKAEIK